MDVNATAPPPALSARAALFYAALAVAAFHLAYSFPAYGFLICRQAGSLPWDRLLAPLAAVVTGGLVAFFMFEFIRRKRTK